MSTLEIETTTVESLIVGGIVTQYDPDTNVPQFQFTAVEAADPEEADWVNGTWQGTWTSASGIGLEAVTPVTNTAGFELVAGRRLLWIRWTAGPHTPVRRVGTVLAK